MLTVSTGDCTADPILLRLSLESCAIAVQNASNEHYFQKENLLDLHAFYLTLFLSLNILKTLFKCLLHLFFFFCLINTSTKISANAFQALHTYINTLFDL